MKGTIFGSKWAVSNCLISCRAAGWHYRIFPDFLFLASKIEGKAKVIACSWNDIKGQITPESFNFILKY